MRFGNQSRPGAWSMVLLLAGLGGCGGGGSQGGSARPGSVIPVGAVAQEPLRIGMHGWYVTQAVQKLDRSVPLVAGRDGVLRVFLTANAANQATVLTQLAKNPAFSGIHIGHQDIENSTRLQPFGHASHH